MLIPESIQSCFRGEITQHLTRESLLDLGLMVRGSSGATSVFVIKQLHIIIQTDLTLDDLSDVFDVIEQALQINRDKEEIEQLFDWSNAILQDNIDSIKDIPCFVAIKLKFTDHFIHCWNYLLHRSLATWDRLREDIKQIMNESIQSQLENQFLHGNSECRIRIYELGLPSMMIWSKFTEDISKFEIEDSLLCAICLESLFDACSYNPNVMDILKCTDILSYLETRANPDNLRILELFAKLPYPTSKSEVFINRLIEWFDNGSISASVCFEHLAAYNQSFSCSETLQQKLYSFINCSSTEDRIPAILATSLVVHTWPFEKCRIICRKVFDLALQPFLDYRLACHKFFLNILKINSTDWVIGYLPAFYEYLQNSSTEHEMEGLQSKWGLVEYVVKNSNYQPIKQVYSKGFSVYITNKSNRLNNKAAIFQVATEAT